MLVAACSPSLEQLRGPPLADAQSMILIWVAPDKSPEGWAFERPLEEPATVPIGADGELYALVSGCPLAAFSLAPGRVALEPGGRALPRASASLRYLVSSVRDAEQDEWGAAEQPALAGTGLPPALGADCASNTDFDRARIVLDGSTGSYPAFGLRLGSDEGWVGIINDGGEALYFRIQRGRAEPIALPIPHPHASFMTEGGELFLLGGRNRQLYRGTLDAGLTSVSSTRAIEAVQGVLPRAWIDGAPDGSELYAYGSDGVIERYRDDRWTTLFTTEPQTSWFGADIAWVRPGEAWIASASDGALFHVIDERVESVPIPDADPPTTLAKHPSLGLLVGTEAGWIFEVEGGALKPAVDDPLTSAVTAIASFGDGFLVSGIEYTLSLYAPRAGVCPVESPPNESRPILGLQSGYLFVSRPNTLSEPVVLERLAPRSSPPSRPPSCAPLARAD